MRVTSGFQFLCVLVLCTACYANLNSGGELGVVRTLSAKTLGKSRLNIGAGLNYAQHSEFMKWELHPQTEFIGQYEDFKSLSSNAYIGLGVASFWDIGVSIPFFWDGSENGGPSDFGIGDLEISTKILYPKPDKPRIFYQSYLLGVGAGVSNMSDKGIYTRHAYYYEDGYDAGEIATGSDIFTADGFVVKGLILWTLDFSAAEPSVPIKVHLNGGVAIPNEQKEISGLANLALEYSPAEVITIFADFASEIRGRTVINEIKNIRRDMMWITPGIKITAPAGVYVSLAADIGLSDYANDAYRITWEKEPGKRYSTGAVPPIGVQFAFGWSGFLAAQDDDKDGIKNKEDRCPKDPEDLDGFEDGDGCPDEDNDNDGILDKEDKCPQKAEDKDGFEDEDGCPDEDNDGDGIVDLKDACPKVAEDFDGFEDKDGCPDTDNDKDGIPDSLDKCPNDVEDFDKFKDDDGCPDVDNDKDGIPDLKDKCPNEPETFNEVNDKDGCPDTKKKKSKMPKHQIMRGVKFKSGRTEMTFDSYQALEPVIQEMKKFPEIEIEIRGHTDSVGKYSTNMRLSQMRAESVRQYLISKGIDSKRVRAVGFGPSSPIADNRTAAGRSANRRIEILRIK